MLGTPSRSTRGSARSASAGGQDRRAEVLCCGRTGPLLVARRPAQVRVLSPWSLPAAPRVVLLLTSPFPALQDVAVTAVRAASPSPPNPNGHVKRQGEGCLGASPPAGPVRRGPATSLCSPLSPGLSEPCSMAGRGDCSMWAFLPPWPSCQSAPTNPDAISRSVRCAPLSPCFSLPFSLIRVLPCGPLAMLSLWP